MAQLLHIEASPRKEHSFSTRVANAFIKAYLETHPGDSVKMLDLWSCALPEFDGAALAAKYAVLRSNDFTAEQAEAWERITRAAQALFDADKLVVSVPMWNFSIPYKLKHFIDVVTQPGVTFSFSPEKGYSGLVPDKPVAVIYARGGTYAKGTASESFDLQTPYLSVWLQSIGLRSIREIIVEPTLGAPDAVQKTEDAALNAVARLARTF